jgi:hypothetical protein
MPSLLLGRFPDRTKGWHIHMAAKTSQKLRILSNPEFKDVHKGLSGLDWQELERLWNTPLTIDTREKIETASRIYAFVGPAHVRNTVTVVKAEKALNDWIKACGRLRLALGATKTSAPLLTKKEIIQRFYGRQAIQKIGKMKPLSFVQYAVEAAMGAAQLAIVDKQHTNISAALEKDFWRAWVAYLANVAKQLGVKVSAASSNKSNNESPFVKGVIFLQQRLPKECRRFNGYDSVAKGVQQARKFEEKSPETLLGILAGWGAGIPEFGEYNFADAELVVRNLLHGNDTVKKGASTSRHS